MTTETEPRFDVVIIDAQTSRIERIAGRNLPMTTDRIYGESVEKRIETVLHFGLGDRYFVKEIPAGDLQVGDEATR